MNAVLLIPDAGPLFSLAAAELLHVLLEARLVVTDVVKEETADRGTLPGASVEALALHAFFAEHRAKIEVRETTVGNLLRLARRTDPSLKLRNTGELSIQSLLISLRSESPATRALVLFEDTWFIRSAMALPPNCTLISTSAFLRSLERSNLIASAAKAEARIRLSRSTFGDVATKIDRAQPGRAKRPR